MEKPMHSIVDEQAEQSRRTLGATLAAIAPAYSAAQHTSAAERMIEDMEKTDVSNLTPELVEALGAMLRLVDGLPWQTRDAVYKAFNERTGGLPGSLPKPIATARELIAKAKGVSK